MDNEVLKTINNRKSLRRYRDEPVPPEVKQAILEAAFRAPTAGNMMLYSILDITDPAIKETLSETCDHQPFIAQAPLLLLFLADYQRMYDYFTAAGVDAFCAERGQKRRKPAEGELFLALSDALIAAQNAVLAAESLGLGSCYIGDIMENYETHRELLGLEDYTFPIALVCFGYPRGDYGARKPAPRYAPEYILFENRYSRIDPRKLTSMADPVVRRYYKDGGFPGEAGNFGQHLYGKKVDSSFSREMTRSIRRAWTLWSGGEHEGDPA